MNTKHIETLTHEQLQELAHMLVEQTRGDSTNHKAEASERHALTALMEAKCAVDFGLFDLPQKYKAITVKNQSGVIAVLRCEQVTQDQRKTYTSVNVGGSYLRTPTNTPAELMRLLDAIGLTIESGTAVTVLARAQSAFEPLATFEQIVSAAVEIMERQEGADGTGIESFDEDSFIDFVTAHGMGEPTQDGIKLGRVLVATGDTMSEAANEVLARGLYHAA